MKKLSKGLFGRLLSVSLALCMCLGLLPLTVFATENPNDYEDPGNYVYVYINVTGLGDTVEEPPEFGSGKGEAAAQQGLADAGTAMNIATTGMTEKLTAVDDAVNALGDAMDTLEAAMGTAEGELGTAQEALNTLQAAQPGQTDGPQTEEPAAYTATEDGATEDSPETEDTDQETSDGTEDTAAPSLEEVQKKVESLNASQAQVAENVAAANETVGELNNAAEKYNQSDNQTADVDNYNEAAEDYNSQAADFNTAIGTYNDLVTEAGEATVEYVDSVTSYEASVTAYNNAVGTYNEAVDAYNQNAVKWNANESHIDEVLWDKIAEKQSSNIVIYQQINAQLTASEDEPAVFEEFTSEEITAYNEVVTAYNNAVEEFNENVKAVTVDKLKEAFGEQAEYISPNGDQDQYWLTVGKIYVGDIFAKWACAIKGNNTLGDQYNGYSGTDVYYWDNTGDDIALTVPENESDMYENGQSVDTLEGRLFGTGDSDEATTELNTGNDSEFTPYGDTDASEVAELTGASIRKWVLKVEDTGATDYDNTRSLLHLDGYLCVQQLGKLALLQQRAETVESAVSSENVESSLQVNSFGVVGDAVQLTKAISYAEAPVSSDPEVEIPEDDVPLADVPEVEIPEDDVPLADEPETEIPEGDVPLADEPETEIPENEVPLADEPEVEIPEDEVPLANIPEADVPMADVPKTGDASWMWYAVALFSAGGLAVLFALKKRENA